MALRKGHGNGAGVPRIEVMPADELPAGVPAEPSPPTERDANGRIVAGPGALTLARRGAQAAKEAKQLNRLLGLWQPPEGHSTRPYLRLCRAWREAYMQELALTVGGGQVCPGAANAVSSAALQLAASRILFDEGFQSGDSSRLLTASKLADASRQNTMAARELAARSGEARKKVEEKRRQQSLAAVLQSPESEAKDDPE